MIFKGGSAMISAIICLWPLSGISQEDTDHPTQVEFVLSKDFRDFKTERLNSFKDRERLEQAMREHFQESADRFLPTGHKLEIRVLDVDLAGHIFPAGSFNQDQRIVKNAYPPRIKLAYRWLDQEDKVILSSQQDLVGHDVMMLSRRASFHNNRVMGLERALIDKWMRELRHYWKDNHSNES